ncbi:MAG: bifunctional hydroxymethylpyrimidine kinase/phosphomethylpyrimidine kinase [Rhodospirillales bacterium CG15_BIG_FIL_POST_REV_8_21_14_020_66_15]|nr:MAG: bifunctional hydroxymethylpyrimidine kinase/phosphomethylpyrimidine kinase [Rhodospirillales bacterium CG15_BIG_FIL_POST_REV_8_21_14_020_66_15]
MQVNGRVLVIAGSDSGGGAGIQADIKTVTALGGYAMTAITALTAQNTRGVSAIQPVPADFVAAQVRAVIDDIGADCIKIGMLHRAEVANAVADALAEAAAGVPLVLDTVMIAKGGHALLDDDAVAVLKTRLLPGAALVTPNLPEAEALTGLPVRTVEDMLDAGQDILALGARAVLMKGGHLDGDRVTDLLVTPEETVGWETPRIDTPHTHGTGCTLASACATGIAQGLDLIDTVARARAYVAEAIRTAPGLGHGHGPLNHGFTVAPFDPKAGKENQT